MHGTCFQVFSDASVTSDETRVGVFTAVCFPRDGARAEWDGRCGSEVLERSLFGWAEEPLGHEGDKVWAPLILISKAAPMCSVYEAELIGALLAIRTIASLMESVRRLS